jgi:Transport protein Trs120 or TRAPPC9, TRAPP II complex subunit
MSASSFILPAYSLHTHTTFFLPRETGRLCIQGCIVKFSTCKSREFLMLGNRTRRERETWYDMRGGEIKIKQIGIGLISPSSIKKIDSAATETEEESFWPQKALIARVLPPQPTLVLERSSIPDAGIMLLEGEM